MSPKEKQRRRRIESFNIQRNVRQAKITVQRLNDDVHTNIKNYLNRQAVRETAGEILFLQKTVGHYVTKLGFDKVNSAVLTACPQVGWTVRRATEDADGHDGWIFSRT